MDQVCKTSKENTKDGPKGWRRKRCIGSGFHTGSNGVQNDSNTASLMAVIFTLLLFVWSQLKSSKSSTEVWLSRRCCCVHVCFLGWFILLRLLNFTAKYHLASTTFTNCWQWKYCIFIIHFMVINLNSNTWNVYFFCVLNSQNNQGWKFIIQVSEDQI